MLMFYSEVGRSQPICFMRWNVDGRIGICCTYVWRRMHTLSQMPASILRCLRQLYFWTYSFSSPRWRNLLCWLVGCELSRCYRRHLPSTIHGADANTIGSVASVASIDWGCAIQIMAAASIGSNETFEATSAQTLYVPLSTCESKSTLRSRKQCRVCRHHSFTRCSMLPRDCGSC
jgi:hypothetical protein